MERLRIHAPDFESGTWINSEPLSTKQLRGRVTLVDFWDFTCVNCLRTLPYLVEWHARYRDRGLTIVGVHAPEFSFAKNAALVEQAVKENGIEYPVLLDNDFKTWQAYANRYWPAKYLVDGEGLIRYHTFGEGRYAQTEEAIQVLLHELDPKIQLPGLFEPMRETDVPGAVCYPTTPELYVGAARGRLGNPQGFVPNAMVAYKDAPEHMEGVLYLDGTWRATAESIEAIGPGYAALRYRAAELNAVMRPVGRESVQITITQNGAHLSKENAGRDVQISDAGVSFVVVDRARMYNLVRNPQFGDFEVRLTAQFGGLEMFAFTFISCAVPIEELPRVQNNPVYVVE